MLGIMVCRNPRGRADEAGRLAPRNELRVAQRAQRVEKTGGGEAGSFAWLCRSMTCAGRNEAGRFVWVSFRFASFRFVSLGLRWASLGFVGLRFVSLASASRSGTAATRRTSRGGSCHPAAPAASATTKIASMTKTNRSLAIAMVSLAARSRCKTWPIPAAP